MPEHLFVGIISLLLAGALLGLLYWNLGCHAEVGRKFIFHTDKPLQPQRGFWFTLGCIALIAIATVVRMLFR